MNAKNEKDKNDYKVVISELGVNPFQIIKMAFSLMSVIPLLVVFYIISKKELLYSLFAGYHAIVMTIAIFVAMTGLAYAYGLVSAMVNKLLKYAAERRLADNEKTEVLVAVSHDIKTPITTVKMGIYNLIDGIGGTLSDAHMNTAKMCLSAVEKVFKFIEEILNFSKVGLLNIRRECLDLGEVVKNEISDLSKIVEKNGLDLRYSNRTESSMLWGDKKKLTRVVMNLLTNAIKYTPNNGAIDVVLTSDETTVQFAVINTGPGITPDEMDKIFKKFSRLEKHSNVEGTGIGLSIVKDIVDLHNGHVTVKSEIGKETEFKVVLPKDLRKKVQSERLR
jgi:signal transduction histidine kinase